MRELDHIKGQKPSGVRSGRRQYESREVDEGAIPHLDAGGEVTPEVSLARHATKPIGALPVSPYPSLEPNLSRGEPRKTLSRGLVEAAPRGILATSNGDPFGLVGTVVDERYLVERVVGCGGFGVVYRAAHLRFEGPVAIKALRIPVGLSEGVRQAFIERFLLEGKLLFGLGGMHPAIARILEAGVFPVAGQLPVPYLAMEWLNGVSLNEQLKQWRAEDRPPLGLYAMIELISPIAEALAAAHEQRIAHRDVKPANIFLARRGKLVTAKLLDFGIAKVWTGDSTTSQMFAESGSNQPAFTPAYAAPEQWLRRLGSTGPWTDVHSLALVCTEILAGYYPLQGDNTQQLLAACLDESARPTPRALGVAIPNSVERVFRRALRVAPRDRFASVAAFWQALVKAAESERNNRKISAPVVGLLVGANSNTRPEEFSGTELPILAAKLPFRASRLRLLAAGVVLGLGGAFWAGAGILVRHWPKSLASSAAPVVEPARESRQRPSSPPQLVEARPLSLSPPKRAPSNSNGVEVKASISVPPAKRHSSPPPKTEAADSQVDTQTAERVVPAAPQLVARSAQAEFPPEPAQSGQVRQSPQTLLNLNALTRRK